MRNLTLKGLRYAIITVAHNDGGVLQDTPADTERALPTRLAVCRLCFCLSTHFLFACRYQRFRASLIDALHSFHAFCAYPPMTTSVVLCPLMSLTRPSSVKRPTRGPMMAAPHSPATPPSMCTTPLPAKSMAPVLRIRALPSRELHAATTQGMVLIMGMQQAGELGVLGASLCAGLYAKFVLLQL